MNQHSAPNKTVTEKKFEVLGLLSDFDFVLHLPLRYEDETQIHKISQVYPGMQVQLEGVVQNVQVSYRQRKQLTATFKDENGNDIELTNVAVFFKSFNGILKFSNNNIEKFSAIITIWFL